jgi:CheY-like chemotaxis protein
MDGLMLARQLRQQRRSLELPLVLLSSGLAHKRDLTGDSGDEMSARCLSKPIKPSQLYQALAEIFAGPEPAHKRTASASEFDKELAACVPLRILLAEDNVVNQKVALRFLERLGYRADVAGNGIEVLEALGRQAYDVVPMDVQMPKLDGLEATRQIHQQWPPERRPWIIAMTANAMQGDREECLAAGMDDYLCKPVQVPDLQAALERAGRERATSGVTLESRSAAGGGSLGGDRDTRTDGEAGWGPDLVAQLEEAFALVCQAFKSDSGWH